MIGKKLDKRLLTNIFLPTLSAALNRVESNNLKLAHYTRFDSAKLIISGRSVWMRNSSAMNDTGEITHGIEAVDYALLKHRQLTYETLSQFHAGLPQQFDNRWHYIRNHVISNIFISCFSEHWPNETPQGRLSMWREYGRPDGVALILNVEPFRLETNALNAYASPVYYGDKEELANKYEEILLNVAKHSHELKKFAPTSYTLDHLGMAILFGAVFLKHPIFKEEQEWRVVHMPNIQIPSLLRKRVLSNSTNEVIYEIPLEDCPDKGLIGVTPDAILHKVIVGPSKNTDTIISGLISVLSSQGVHDPRSRIVESKIPLRVD